MRLNQVDADWAWREFQPRDAGEWNADAAAHLHRRAGFGATQEELKATIKQSPGQAVDEIVAAAEADADAPTYDTLTRSVLAGGDPKGLASAWTYRMLTTSAQLREKLTLFWHGHFATSAEKVEDAKLMHQQNQLLRKQALGDFAEMVQGVSKDPAMLIYLDSVTNRKAHPNENYAREVMELFCLGEGNYEEQDVLELARCFTGWEIKRGKYRFNRYQHDFGEKSIFGKRGEFTGEQGVELVLEHPKGPEFIAGKLVQFFVSDELSPTAELVAPLAAQLRADDWQLAPTVRRILASNLFFSGKARAAKVRSPIEFAVGVLRCLHGSTNSNTLAEGCQQLGQGLFYPPNVKGWDGGRTWINSSTLLGRANLMQRIIQDEKTRFAGNGLTGVFDRYEVEGLDAAVAWLAKLLVAPPLDNEIRGQLAAAAEQGGGDKEARAKRLLYLLCAMPECQLA